MEEFELAKRLKDNINRVFVGKEDVVEKLLICLFAGGHVLLEDVPGVGKTTLANALARSMQGSFGRIQFTPDTLPGDVTGVSVYNRKTEEFEYRPGAVMNQILLADEINRTSPKTQASLLEAMAEGQVTVDGAVHGLPQPFMVIATQNPIEFIGTYALPEAQLDRFMMRLTIGYPGREEEIRMALQLLRGQTPDRVEVSCSVEEVLHIRDLVSGLLVKESVIGYMDDIISSTRRDERFLLGASPRAFLSLLRASQARAFLQGRDFVKPDDVKAIAPDVLLHRLVPSSEAKIRKENSGEILNALIRQVKVPIE